MRHIRKAMDSELAAAITAPEAVARGLVPVEKTYAVRIWNNIALAVDAKESAGEGAVLVWQRDKKDVQVWVKPSAETPS